MLGNNGNSHGNSPSRIEVAQQSRSPLYKVFLDISKAYDCVDQQILWSILQDLGLESNDIALLRALYSGVTAQVEWDGHVTAPVSVSCGLCQGCPLSPVLFMLYVAGLTQRLKSSGLGYALQHHEEGQLVARRFPALVYADDFAVLAGSPGELQQLLDMCGTEMTPEAEVQPGEMCGYGVGSGCGVYAGGLDTAGRYNQSGEVCEVPRLESQRDN